MYRIMNSKPQLGITQYLINMRRTCQTSLCRIFIQVHVVWLFISMKTDHVSLAPTKKLNITIFTKERSWNEAYYACQYHGMELLTMKSQDSADALSLLFENNSIISLSDTDFWFGLYVHDAETENFRWTDGDGLGNWTRWFSPEPNAMQSDRCVRLHNDPTNSFEWKTMKCDRSYPFICQQYIGECTMELTPFLPVEGTPKTVENIDSENDCNNWCLSVILNSTEQCYFAYKKDAFCDMYLSEKSEDFVAVDEGLPRNENYYRKICFQGFQSQIMVNYTNTDTIPVLTSIEIDSNLNSSEINTFNQKTTTVITTSLISSEIALGIPSSDDAVMYEEITTMISPQHIESSVERDTSSITSSEPSITVVLKINKLSSLSSSILTSQNNAEYLNLYGTSPWTITDVMVPTPSVVIGASEIPDQSMLISSAVSSAFSNQIFSSEVSILSLSGAETETIYELPLSLTSSKFPEYTTYPSVFSGSELSSLEIHSSSEIWSIYSKDMSRTTDNIVTLVSHPTTTTIPTPDYFTFKKQCACPCREKRDFGEQNKKVLIEKLLVPKKTTMLYQRKLYSVPNQRTSCQILGTLGILLVFVPFVLNTLNDCRTFITELYSRYHYV